MKQEKNMSEETPKEQEKQNVEQAEENTNAETAETQPETQPKEESIEDKLAAAEAKIAELQDKYLRQVAEFDNYRKRTIKEKAELILNGAEKTVTAILPVLDDLERALKNMDKMEDLGAVKKGVDLIYQKFVKVLGDQGVKKIDTENADFNIIDFVAAVAAGTVSGIIAVNIRAARTRA